ncbi:cysteine desulfurase family protein [Collinsella intestinalis]|uniref:cysteine desulfurase family protein n=1 Tax=Collinsella intestinalis TaxID=147207 RepID=UPI0025A35549|nr:aminotransferase class V-fold PLP-dependent enzyme [Collinsella intestinalis]MDM8162339.1 aminotransferase class V-fold PLP-dependent enzyme [Collinsella intestinalis]
MADVAPIVNLDFAASTPLRHEAREAERTYDASPIAGANPNALHRLGRAAAQSLEEARRSIARSLGARVRPSEVVLTGGGTEADQLALLGIAEGVRERDRTRTRVVVSAIEHDAILDNLPLLRAAGFETALVYPNRQGVVEPGALRDLMGRDVALVSIMLANNETGVIQPVRELAAVAHEAGARIHTDAIQGYLHIPFDVGELGVDALSLAGHKVGGPVSTGALYLASRAPLRPRVFGGGQEAGRRAGTQDVRGALALAAVARALGPHVAEERCRVGALADDLYRRLLSHPRIRASMGDPFQVDRLPGIVSVLIEGADSQELVLRLDAAGFAVSAGSACSSGSTSASHVLRAMGLTADEAAGSLRISFDDRVDPSSLTRFADVLRDMV